MFSTLYIGATGLTTHGKGMNVLSSNIANVNTTGYKKQSALFQDVFSDTLSQGTTVGQAFNQVGNGSQLGDIRTNFEQGSFEPSNTVTDLAIEGNGYFQVTKGDDVHYTRAGNFRFSHDGFLEDPNGYVVSGIPITEGEEITAGGAQPIQIDFLDETVAQNVPLASSSIEAQFNLSNMDDTVSDAENPFFSMATAWDGTQANPLSNSSYAFSYPMTVYDAEGTAQELTIYFDKAPGTGGTQVFEYVVGMDPALDGRALAQPLTTTPDPNDPNAGTGTTNPTDPNDPNAGTGTTDPNDPNGETTTSPAPTTSASAGLLMAGTITFSSSGSMLDMSAFSPTGADPTDLTTWTTSALVNGLPSMDIEFKDMAGEAVLTPQSITLDLGLASGGEDWTIGENFADPSSIGTDPSLLPSLGEVSPDVSSSTAYDGSSRNVNYSQDGFGKGDLHNMYITDEGIIELHYTNGVVVDAYAIPLYRMTSEDNLRREGNNHFSAPTAAGEIITGIAGSDGYGTIAAGQIETSNVDMAFEMVNMIVMQQGFQSNSKSVTTADEMLQKALELKRS